MLPFTNPMPFNVQKFPSAPSLYIGNLHESVDDQILYDFFSRFGSVHFVRVMRDITTGLSRGYGFVNFLSGRDAESAKQYGQYEVLCGKPLRIMYKQTINKAFNVVVKNLDKAVNERQLHEFFNSVATVQSVHIRRFKDISLGFVGYSTIEEVNSAIGSLNNQKLGEKEIILEKFVDKLERAVKKSIYLKNLLFQTEEEANKWITTNFEPFGKLSSFKAFTFKAGVFSAFICYENTEDAEKAFAYISQNKPDPNLYINWHICKSERKEQLAKNNIYLKNLRLDVEVKDLENIFKSYGKVESIQVKNWESKDKKKTARFALILFDSEQTALSALRNASADQNIQSLALEGSQVQLFPYQTKKTRQQYLLSLQRRKAFDYQVKMQHQLTQFRPFPNQMPPFNRAAHYNQAPYQRRTYNQNFGRPQMNSGHRAPYGRNTQHAGQRNVQNGQQRPNGYNQNFQQNNLIHNQQQNQQRNNHVQPRVEQRTVVNNVMKNQPTQNQAAQNPLPIGIIAKNIKAKLNELMAMSLEGRKKILGEILFPMVIQKTTMKLAPKITGMLIDLEVEDVIELIENDGELNERIAEAKELLGETPILE